MKGYRPSTPRTGQKIDILVGSKAGFFPPSQQSMCSRRERNRESLRIIWPAVIPSLVHIRLFRANSP